MLVMESGCMHIDRSEASRRIATQYDTLRTCSSGYVYICNADMVVPPAGGGACHMAFLHCLMISRTAH